MLINPFVRIRQRLDTDMSGRGAIQLGLFTANVTPDGNTVLATLTSGAPSWANPVVMTGLTAAADDGSGTQFVTWDDITFTNTGGSSVNVYGYYVATAAGTALEWSERNAAAPVSVPNGGTYTVKAKFTRKNQ